MERTRIRASLLCSAALISIMAFTSPVATASGASASSPLAGAWVAKLTSRDESFIQTFTFVPITQDCSQFVLNAQTTTRLGKVIKFWPDATSLTEFVGTASPSTWEDLQFTALSYGVARSEKQDQIRFIAIMTGRIEMPGGGASDPTAKIPDELQATIYISYFDAGQDLDGDGFPDCDSSEAVLCVCFDTKLKRVPQREPCEESKSFVACLEKCKDVNTPATGRAFFRILEGDQKICFVLTVKGIQDVTKATVQVNGTDALTLFPFPPNTKGKDGDCEGLLSSGSFSAKDCYGPWKNKKFADIEAAMAQGQATVVVFTKKCPKGEICGKTENP